MAWGVQFLRCRVMKTKQTINTPSSRQLDILVSAHTRGGEISSDPPVAHSNTDSTTSPQAVWLLETSCHPVMILDCFRNKICYKEGNKPIEQVMTYKSVFKALNNNMSTFIFSNNLAKLLFIYFYYLCYVAWSNIMICLPTGSLKTVFNFH